MRTNRRPPQPRLSWLTVLLLTAQRLRERLAPAPPPRPLALSAPRPPATVEPPAATPAAVQMTTFGKGGAGRVQPQAEPPFWTYFVPNPVIPPRWPRTDSSLDGHDSRR